MAINFNTGPYYDDFDPAKNFYRVLFKPGYAVQARELNQLQSILQHQISSMGDHVFKKNSIVVPGGIALNTAADIVSVVADATVLETLVGKTITNKTNFDYTDDDTLTNCITAVVLGYKEATTSDPAAIYVKYFKAQDDGRNTFNKSETLKTVDGTLLEIAVDSTIGSTVGKVATISAGTFYTKETFVDVAHQSTIIEVDRFTTTNCTVGLNIIESIVTADDDESLLDNANGSPNQYAPGADRYKIELVLTRIDLTTTVDDEKFIKLMDIENNVITYINNKTQYAELMTMLARRTYDANGNFIVRGLDTTITDAVDDSYIWANVSGGKCYLGGYEYEQLVTTPVAVAKPRDAKHQQLVNPISTYQSTLTYIYVAGGSYLKELPVEGSLVQFVDTNPVKATFNGASAPNTSTDIITITGHRLATGNAVTYSNGGGTSIGGLTTGSTYYVIRVSADTIKLATSAVNAAAGTAIDLSSAGVGASHTLKKNLNVIGYGVFKDIQYALGTTNSTDVYKMFFDYISLERGYTLNDIGGVKALKTNVPDEGAPVLHQLRIDSLTGLFTSGNTIISTTDSTQTGLMYYSINNYVYVIKNTTRSVPNSSVVKDTTTNATAQLKTYFVTNYDVKSYPMIELDKDTIKTLYNNDNENITSYSIVRRDVFNVAAAGAQTPVTLSGSNDLFEDFSTSDYFAYITDTGYEQFVDLTGLITVTGNSYTLTVPSLPAAGGAMIGRTVWVYSTVNKGKVLEAPKTTVNVTSGDVIPTPSNSWMALGKQDITNITKIVDGKTVGIDTASWTSSVATITTGVTHNINVGDVVVVSGVKSSANTTGAYNAGYNGKFTVTGVNAGSKTFTYALASNPGTYSTSTSDIVALPPNINTDTDITNRYIFDSGNTAYLSGTGMIKLKKGVTPPRGQIAVQYSYYTVGTGNYISVDSYPHEAGDVSFIGSIADVTSATGDQVEVRRYIDFRARTSSYFFKNIGTIANASAVLSLRDLNVSYHASALVGKYVVGPGFLNGVLISSVAFNASTGNTDITLASTASGSYTGTYYIGLNGTSLSLVDASAGGKSFEFPKDNTRIEYQYVKFLPKHVMVYVNRTGDLLKVDYKEINGKMDAVKLQRDEFKLPLAYMYMDPYTISVRNVTCEKFENPVYQMLDIHNIKRQVDRNEYYSALALQNISEEVHSASNETDTTASLGIWAEDFNDVYQQDYTNDDYKCTIYGNDYVAPGTVIRTIPLEHDKTLNISTWKRTGTAITLPYTEVRAFGNPYASRSNNLNPFNVVNWSGKLTLNPSVDNWVDIVSAPSTGVSTSTSSSTTSTSSTSAGAPVVVVTPVVVPPPTPVQPAPVVPPVAPVVEIVTEVNVLKQSWGPDSQGGRHAITFTWKTNTGRIGRVNTDMHLSTAIRGVGGSAGYDGSYARSCINKTYKSVSSYLNAGVHFDQKPPQQW